MFTFIKNNEKEIEILLDGLIPFNFLLDLYDPTEADLFLILSLDNLLFNLSDILAHVLYNALQIIYLRIKHVLTYS